VPVQPLDPMLIERQIDGFARSVRSLDDNVKELHERITDAQKRLTGPYKSNWQKIAQSFESLGKSFELDQAHPNNSVQNAIQKSAHVLHKIGAQHEDHGKRDLEQLLDFLYTYKGMFANIPDIINIHRSALSKIRDNERLQSEGRISPHDAEAIRQRVDVTSYSMIAEINNLTHERDNDFRQAFTSFFEQQATFYADIGKQMAGLAETFKNS